MLVFSLFIMALSFDTFIAALTYEGNKINISFLSNLIISGVCSLSLIISLFLGDCLDNYLANNLIRLISFIMLFSLGIFKIFGDTIKKRIQKAKSRVCFLDYIIKIYCDYKKADYDKSNDISKLEAVLLGTALSFDNLASGIAFRVSYSYFIVIFLFSFFINFLSILSTKIFKNININFSFIGGMIFIIIAFLRL